MTIITPSHEQINTCDCHQPASPLCPEAKRLWEKVIEVARAFEQGQATQDDLDAARNAFVKHMGGQ